LKVTDPPLDRSRDWPRLRAFLLAHPGHVSAAVLLLHETLLALDPSSWVKGDDRAVSQLIRFVSSMGVEEEEKGIVVRN
jgi:hypothetical protein